ncbi:unnamed protein product [Enterobius vermicularis]|uniref:Vesicle transport protein n=1 Tax=Enterobius vermicularis TaxID=51028 RepID=A0A0N4UVW7_ENTVE|nr:unnamed protein product [Enterobius vermicularis]
MSSLQDFVNQQKAKQSSIGSTSSFSLPRIGRSSTIETESLTETASTSGQLPSAKNRKNSGWLSSINSDEGNCGLSRTQRILAFFMFLIAALFSFGTAVVMLPLVVVQARKFAALNTLGSVMLMLSFAFLLGPLNYLKHMFSEQRRVVTLAYLLTVFATLYSSLWLRSTLVTIFFSIIQAIALVWFVLSYAPGGERGLLFIAGLFSRFVKSKTKTVLPI